MVRFDRPGYDDTELASLRRALTEAGHDVSGLTDAELSEAPVRRSSR